jgi:hypothetical protein
MRPARIAWAKTRKSKPQQRLPGCAEGWTLPKKANCGQPRLSAWGKPSKWRCAFLLTLSWHGAIRADPGETPRSLELRGSAVTQRQNVANRSRLVTTSASRREPLQCRPVPGMRHLRTRRDARAGRERQSRRVAHFLERKGVELRRDLALEPPRRRARPDARAPSGDCGASSCSPASTPTAQR